MNGVTEDEVIEALEYGHEQIKKLVEVQERMGAEIGKPKMEYPDFSLPKDLVQEACEKFSVAFKDAFDVKGKLESYEAIDKVKEEYLAYVLETRGEDEFESNKGIYKDIAKEVEKIVFRNSLVKTHKRADGRALDEIRPIDIEVGVFPMAHGSALFTRGETQALVVATLGSKMTARHLKVLKV